MTNAAAADAWLVIPLFNEERVIADVVASARECFPNIVCVDDGSSDSSADRAASAGAVVVRHPINLGQGAALQTGIQFVLEQTDGQYVVTFDADGQHDVSDAEAMVALARAEDVAIVLGSRFLDDRTRPSPLKRLVLKTAVVITNCSTGMKLTDAHNGLRVLRRDAAAQVHMVQNRMAHASEIVEQLGRTHLPWRECPVHVNYTDYSKSKGQSVLNSVNILVDLVFK